MGGWLEKWGLKLISSQVVVEVEVGVEFGNKRRKMVFSRPRSLKLEK